MRRNSFLGGVLVLGLMMLLGLSNTMYAQYHVKTWKTSDYPFKLTTVLDMAQDDEGFIWMATDGKGVLRFDGMTFTQFTAENTPAFHSNSISNLMFDQEGALWFASKGGGITKYKNGSFNRPLQRFKDVNQIMLTLAETPDGAMWFGSDGGGLYRLKDDSLQNLTTSNSNIPYNNIFSLAVYKGKLLAGLYGTAVEIDYESELTFTPIDPISEITLSINIIDDFAWLGTGNGIYKYDGSSIENYQTGGDRYASHITDFIKDSSGNFWATTYNGLFKFDPKEGSFTPKSFYDSRWPYFTIFEDANNNLWLPPVGMGISRIRPTVFTSLIKEDQLPGSIISVQQIGPQNFVFSTNEGLFQYQNGKVTSLSDNIPSTSPLLVDSKQRLWVGSRNGGLVRYQNGSLQTTELDNPSVNALYESSDESIWVGTVSSGVFQWQPNTRQLQSFELSNSTVTAITEDSSGAIWVGTNYGLNKITEDTTDVYGDEDKKELPDPVITSLYTDEQNNIWVGTSQSGLLLHDNGKFHAFNVDEGIPASYVDQIKVDRHGYIWLGSQRGLYRVSRQQLLEIVAGKRKKVSPNYFSVINGLPSLDLSAQHFPAGTATSDGKFLYNFGEAIVTVDPSLNFIPTKPAAPVVQKVSFDYEDIPTKEAHTVPPSVNSIEIDYTVPDFGAPEQIKFRYKMEPFDKNWVDANKRRTAFYTNLPAGDYEFKISASNISGSTSNITSFPISVVPPWYRTSYAYFGYGLLLIIGIPTLVLGYNYWNTKRLEAHNKQLRSEVKARTEQIRKQKNKIEEQVGELEKQRHQRSRFFANISHEFRTPLTLIITPLEDMLGGEFGSFSPRAQQQLQQILHSARRVNQLTSQLLDLSRLEAGKMPRNPEKIDLTKFIESFTNEFSPLAQREGIDLSFSTHNEPLVCHIDQDILMKMLGNLLSNAFKFTPAQESISVAVSKESDMAVITITDTGIGIAAEKLNQIFDRFYQIDPDLSRTHEGAGIGLALVKELVESTGGQMEAESAENEGTTFRILLPLATEPAKSLVTRPDFQKHNTEKVESDKISGNGQYSENNNTTPLTEQDKPLLLIVDDHPEIRTIIAQQFADDYRTLEADNGSQALDIALDKLPDLVICDIMMPKTDGITFLKNLRKDPTINHLPVVMLTAKSEEINRLNSLQVGADAYITKPFSRKELAIRVQKLIEKQQKLRKYFRKKVLAEADETEALSDDEQFILRLKEIVEANLANPDFTNKQFAKEAGCSRSKLNRKLKKIMNTTPNQFVRSYRLKKSKQLLQQNSATISEIAYSVGFNSLSYFSKCFKEEFGHPPSKV